MGTKECASHGETMDGADSGKTAGSVTANSRGGEEEEGKGEAGVLGVQEEDEEDEEDEEEEEEREVEYRVAEASAGTGRKASAAGAIVDSHTISQRRINVNRQRTNVEIMPGAPVTGVLGVGFSMGGNGQLRWRRRKVEVERNR